jgi:BlaI family transcriptional regulator, penicillinase repressor
MTAPLTPLELEIMTVLWRTGTANVQTVQEGLPRARALTYSSVQTMLNLLVKKGKATRELQGRAFLYRPAMERKSAVGLALKDLIDHLFDGSAEKLVVGLVETSQLDPDRLAELQKTLQQRKEKPDGTG